MSPAELRPANLLDRRLLSAQSEGMGEVTQQSSWSLDKPLSIIFSCIHESMGDSMGVMPNFYNLYIYLFQSLLGRQHNLPGLCWACVSTSAQPEASYLEVVSARLLLSVTFTKYFKGAILWCFSQQVNIVYEFQKTCFWSGNRTKILPTAIPLYFSPFRMCCFWCL